MIAYCLFALGVITLIIGSLELENGRDVALIAIGATLVGLGSAYLP